MVEDLFPLEIANAEVRKRGKKIIGPVNLNLQANGFTIVLGPNGSGKTTLLRLMHGLEYPRAGSVNWACSKNEAQKRQSFVFQTPVMMRRTVLENLRYPLKVAGHGRAQSLELAQAACKEINLEKVKDLEAKLLSGGEKQILALARALITKPDVLFLDEPTANLDGKSTRSIEDMLTEALNRGTRIVMATHDLGQARRLATEVFFLYRGQLHEQSNADDFFAKPETVEAKAFLAGEILE